MKPHVRLAALVWCALVVAGIALPAPALAEEGWTYALTLDGNGGTMADGSMATCMDNLEDGETYPLPSQPFANPGKVFEGWSLWPEPASTTYLLEGTAIDGSFAAEGKSTLYAQWRDASEPEPTPTPNDVVDPRDQQSLAPLLAGFMRGVGSRAQKRVSLAPLVGKSAVSAGSKVTMTSGTKNPVGSTVNTITTVTLKYGSENGYAFCINPGRAGVSGSQPTVATAARGSGRSVAQINAGLWFGYGGPGFDSSMWPAKDYGGSALTSGDRFVYTHLIMTYLVYGTGQATPKNPYWDLSNTATGGSSAYLSWVKTNITEGSNSVAQKMLKRVNEVSPQFSSFIIHPSGGGTSYQDYIGWVDKGFGTIEINKVSGSEEITKSNLQFSLADAKYSVYTNDGKGTSTFIQTDANGKGTLYHYGVTPLTKTKLTAGTYKVFEATASKGYGLDPKTYTVTVSANSTAKLTSVEPVPNGKIKLVKRSANEAITTGNPCYDLVGATYGVYTDESCSTLYKEMVVGSDGTALLEDVPQGTYYLKERKAPKGYSLADKVLTCEVANAATAEVVATDVPQVDTIDVVVQKVDAETKKAVAQGAASLAGAHFRLDYYAGTHGADSLPNSPTRSWTLRTNDQGQAFLDESSLVSGDDWYLDQSGHPTLPLGTVAVSEIAAPKGYRLPQDARPSVQTITASGTAEQVKAFVEPTTTNPTIGDVVIRGGISVRKVDADDGSPLEGATFEIRNASAESVVVGDSSHAPGERCLTITSGKDGWATTAADALPFGSYEVRELTAPYGYAINAAWKETVTISDQGKVVAITKAVPDKRITIQTRLEATKLFDGTSQGKTLRAGLFKFDLLDQGGSVLQTVTNDGQGKVSFAPITYDYRDLDKTFTYQIREMPGTDEEIIYDGHVETVKVTISADDQGKLVATQKTDANGVVFENRTVPAIELPLTGQAGNRMGLAGLVAATGTAGTLVARRRRSRRA